MQATQPTYTQLIDAYIKGKLSDKDADSLMEAVASGKADTALEERFATDWLHAGPTLPHTEVLSAQRAEALYEAIAQKIEPQQAPAPVRTIRSKSVWWAVAAALVGMLSVGTLWQYTVGSSSRSNSLSGRIPASGYNTVHNSGIALQQVALQDGSTVSLMPGATLHYPEDAGAHEARVVYLEGDAFFDVAHLQGKKFIVEGSRLTTEVLGTSFWVRQNEEESTHAVEVRSGKVKVMAQQEPGDAAPKASVILLPNQQVSLVPGKKELVKSLSQQILPLSVRQADYPADQDADFALNYTRPTPLKQVVRDLEKMYGVSVEVENEAMLGTLMNGNLTHIHLQNKLEAICLSIGASFTLEADRVVLHASTAE